MDDLGTAYDGPRPARRVVSLVPSLTEALASVDRDAVVGATDWCTHPADLGAARVRGTKNPDLAAVRALEPDVVVANQEENRELDVRRLRESGVRVWVTRIETVPEAVGSMERLLDGLGWERPTWLGEARRLWCGPVPPVSRRVAIPVWRDPWMVVGARTFTGDLARRLGLDNVFADHPDRYPAASPEQVVAAAPDVVLLPDEPYLFTADDGPEVFAGGPDGAGGAGGADGVGGAGGVATELVSGRLLTWYGPSLLEAHRSLAR